MAESELEEGEACYYKEDHVDVDDKTTFDPDKDLSYIDEKIQSVLGHFQKCFDGGVIVENQGAAFGGYGSFLPMHQRCPLVKYDSKTPQISQNYNRPRSPNNLQLEGVPKNSLVPSKVPPSLKDGKTALALNLHDRKSTSLDGSTKLDSNLLPAQAAATIPARSDSSSKKPGNQTDQKRIRLRIKMRSNCSAQKNDAIYSGLGLTSPSSPVGHSPKDSGRDPSVSYTTPVESPSCILQYMTSFPDTGNMLLSPLHPSLLNLTAKKNNVNNKLYIPIKVHQNGSAASVDSPASKVIKDRKRKLVGGTGTVEEDKHGVGVKYVSNPISPAQKHTKFETTEEKQYISSDLRLKSLSSPACNSGESSTSVFRINQAKREVAKDVPPKKRIMKKDWVKDRTREESVKLMHGHDSAKYGQQELKSGLMTIQGQGTKSLEKNISDDLRGGRAKGDRICTLSKDQLDVSKRKKDTNSNVNNHPNQKVGLSCTQNKLPLDEKTKSKGRQSVSQLTSHLIDERFRSDNILKSKERPQKNVAKLPAGSEDMHDLRLQRSANKMDPLERSSRDCMTKDQKIEMVKEKDVTDDIAQPDGQASESVDEWVQCDSCDTWRLLPYGVKSEQLPDNWLCSMLDWLPGMNRCDISETETTNAVLALHQPPLLIPESNKFQSHVDQVATGVSPADVPSLNQDVGIHAMRNRGKKKPTAKEISAVSSSGVFQTSSLTKNSRESMKNRFLNDMNTPLSKVNLISESTKCPDNFSDSSLGRSACKQIDEGATKLKRLRLKREPDQSGYRASKRVMTEGAVFNDDHRNPISCGTPARMGCGSSAKPPSTTWNNTQRHNEHLSSKDGNCELKDSVPISVKSLRNTSPGISNSGSMGMKKNNEIHGMKRKLKDRQDSQNHLETFCSKVNNLPDDEFMKEMKPRVSMTEGQESSACRGDAKLNKKGKATRIIVSGSRDSLTTTRNDQQQQKFSKSYKSKLTLDDIVKLKEDLGCEQLSAAATSSSSKVSGSRKRSSYRKVRGSPVESVSSSPLRSSNLAKVSLTRRGSLGNDYADTSKYSAGGPIQSLEHGSKLDRDQIGVGSRGEVSGVFQAESMSFPKLECQDYDLSGEAYSNVKVKPLYDLKSKHVLANNEDTFTQHQQCLTDAHSLDDCQSAERGNTTLDVTNDTVLRIPGNDSSLLLEDIDKSSYDGEKGTMKPSDLSSDRGFKPSNDKNTAIRRSEYSQGDIKLKILGHNCSNEKSVDLYSSDGKSIHEDKSRGEFAKPSNSTRAELSYGKTHAHPHHAVKQETPTHVRQPVSLPLKGSDPDTCSSIGCCDVSKVLQQTKNSVHQNGAHKVEGNQAVSQSIYRDIGIVKPVKGYNGGQAATDILREAEDLKGHADHLKKSGFSFDSIMANFQAALKSLLGASLLESATSRSGRSDCGEIPQVQIYSSSAKLFETCAQDFGKHDEMYAAALAYKCTEVAYLRSLFCKSYMADKDRSDLLANLQMLPQGESPSSSASDVDSLYNQVTMDKTALLRGMASNAANHVTIVQSRPTIIRVLQYTHDMSSAMEASEKSGVAFEAANEILKKGDGGATAVKRVLDSSFQDIEEFTRLVRLANEVICSSHI